jgi:hypothetical protein
MSYATQQAILEAANFENDPRVRAARRGDFFKAINDTNMTVAILIFHDETEEGQEEELVWFPFRYDVCDVCHGRGEQVNPSIDSGGLTAEDFAEDPDFAESYFSGAYNEPCSQCSGNKVYPTLDEQRFNDEQKQKMQLVEEKWRADADYEAECRAERMMGA